MFIYRADNAPLLVDMPTPESALIYPGTCMFEGTSVSEGRGSTRPFEVSTEWNALAFARYVKILIVHTQLLGATFTNTTWSETMRSLEIPYANFRFACFSPTTSKFMSQTVCGLQSYISLDSPCDYASFDPVYLGVSLLWTAKKLYSVSGNDSGYGNTTGSFHWIFNTDETDLYDVDVLTGGTLVREGIETGLSPDDIRSAWEDELSEFKKKRQSYLLY